MVFYESLELLTDDFNDNVVTFSYKTKGCAERSQRMQTEEDLESFDDVFFSDDISTEKLSLESTGVTGILERIPLSFKLVLMCAVSLFGLLVLGGLLLSSEAQSVKQLKQRRKVFSHVEDVRQWVHALQTERDVILNDAYQQQIDHTGIEYANVQNSSFMAEIEQSDYWMNKVSGYWDSIGLDRSKNYTDTRLIDLIEAVYRRFELDIYPIRAGSAAYPQIGNGKYIHAMYTDLISLLLRLIVLTKQRDDSPIMFSHINFIHMLELQQQSRLVGMLFIAAKRISLADTKDMYAATVPREHLLNQWLYSVPSDISNIYEERILRNDNTTWLRIWEMMLSAGSAPVQYIQIRMDDWRNATNDVIQDMKKIAEITFDRILIEHEREKERSVIKIVVIVVVIAICFVLSVLASVLCSATIISPWMRINRLLTETISKFVPNAFLRLINCSDIMQVKLGRFVEKNITIVSFSLEQFTSGLENEQVFDHLNSFLSHLGPLVRRFGGFIDKHAGGTTQVLFVNPQQALKASISINETFKLSIPEYTNISIALHCGPTLVGIIGEEGRMEPTIISKHVQVPLLLRSICSKLQSKMLTTKCLLRHISKRYIPASKMRTIGNLKVENEVIEVYELITDENDQSKIASKEDFELGLQYFHQGLYNDAIDQFNKVIESDSSDLTPKIYLQKAEQILNQIRYIRSRIPITEIITDELLSQPFANYCDKESSLENILLWRDIEEFRCLPDDKLVVASESIYRKYLHDDGRYTINTTDPVKKALWNQIKEASVDRTLFDELQSDVEYMMKDTWKRFRETRSFYQVFAKHEKSPPVPLLDEL